MSKPGITPTSSMRKKPTTRKISFASAVHHIAGQEQSYPVYGFSNRVFVERPNHNPFANIQDPTLVEAFSSGFDEGFE